MKFRLHIKDGAENGCLKVENTVTEVLCKSHYVKNHMQLGQSPITVADDSCHYLGPSLNCFSILFKSFLMHCPPYISS